MNAFKLLAVFSVLTSSALAQAPGPFVTVGGGFAQIGVGRFAVYNPVAATSAGERLKTTDTHSIVNVERLNVGYNITENWALQIGYAKYGTGKVNVAFPDYPDMVWALGAGPDVYSRHAVMYKPTTITLMPTYTKAVTDKSRVIFGVGICSTKTTSHFETTYKSGAVVFPAPTFQSHTYAEETNDSKGLVVLVGLDREIMKHFSAGITGNYSSMKMNVPASPWATRTKTSVDMNAFSLELYLGAHW